MVRQDVPTERQMNFISVLQNSPKSRTAVREYLNSHGKAVTNSLTRGEASDLIKLLIFIKKI